MVCAVTRSSKNKWIGNKSNLFLIFNSANYGAYVVNTFPAKGPTDVHQFFICSADLQQLRLEKMWIAFGLRAKFNGFQFMILQKLSGLTEQVEHCSSMHSLDVMWCLPIVVKEKILQFRRGTSVVKFLKP